MSVDEFLVGRTELSPQKIILLRYLEMVADSFSIASAPRGRSTIECRFDCGAFKGDEILHFRVSVSNPITVAASLLSLTSGHHFSFPEAEQALLASMEGRLA